MNLTIKGVCGYLTTMRRKILLGLFIIGLIYILLPEPSSIDDFPPLPNSVKSDLDGDTWQNPNLAAYFSDYRRDFITKFYRNNLTNQFLLGWLISPVSLNHPPEKAYQYIRDQQESTFLEEYTYPLRGSIFVNGYEPLTENRMNNKEKEGGFVGNHIYFKQNPYNSKATLRYYPSPLLVRVTVYLVIWSFSILLWKLYVKSVKE